jgi:hypothetical protein
VSTSVQDLIPEMIEKVQRFLSLVPIPYVVTSTLRTVEEQVAYYSQGRATLPVVNLLRQKAGLKSIGNQDNTYTVTNCDGVNTKSNHQSGRAIDVVPEVNGGPSWPPNSDPRWRQIAQAGKAAGLSWGGEWATPDSPHYEMARG